MRKLISFKTISFVFMYDFEKKKTKQCQFVQITMKLNSTDKQVNNLEREYNH